MAPRSLCLVIAFWILSIGILEVTATNKHSVMVWMCLQRCGANISSIGSDLLQIEQNLDIFAKVSFESYGLGANSTLVAATDVTNVNPELALMGVPRFPMVSTYPHPPIMVPWMLQLFANPQPFTDQVIDQILHLKLAGINIDLEPANSGDFTAEDGVAYANFLQTFSQQVHAQTSAIVQVCVATWSPLWNLTLIGQTEVDQVLTMSTYTTDWVEFQKQFFFAIDSVPLSKLGIGIQTDLTDVQGLQDRFDLIDKYQVNQVAIWSSPVPNNWLPIISSYVT